MPKLILSIDGVIIREVQLTQERTTLGRRPHNDIVIEHLAVSGEHAVLHCTGDTVVLQDLQSTNGSYVNGRPVQRQALAHGDLLEVGRHQLRFFLDTDAGDDSHPIDTPIDSLDADGSTPLFPLPGDGDSGGVSAQAGQGGTPATGAGAAAPSAPVSYTTASASARQTMPSGASLARSHGDTALAPAALGHAAAPPSARVQVLSGGAAGREVALTKVVTTIGKPGTAVASITRRHHGFVLAHVEGPHHTVLNGTAIGTASLPLSSGDLIELAGTQMRFLQP